MVGSFSLCSFRSLRSFRVESSLVVCFTPIRSHGSFRVFIGLFIFLRWTMTSRFFFSCVLLQSRTEGSFNHQPTEMDECTLCRRSSYFLIAWTMLVGYYVLFFKRRFEIMPQPYREEGLCTYDGVYFMHRNAIWKPSENIFIVKF